MSLQSLLSIAKTALVTHQRALDVTSHNIANVNTDGYSRQRAELVAQTPLLTPQGPVGRGVTDKGVTAARDGFLDASFRRETGVEGQAGTLRDLMTRVEDAFGEPSDTGIGASLDAFYDAFADLANDPSSTPARTLVQQAGRALAQRVQQVDGQLTQLENETVARMQSAVSDVNSIAAQIADLNRRIVSTGGPLHSAPDLEDARSTLIDKLSTMAGVRVLDRPDGSVGVLAGDTLLVDGGQAQTLELRSLAGGGFGVAVQGAASVVEMGGGSLSAMTQFTKARIPSVRADLDLLVSSVVSGVNAIHQTGTTPAGATATDFFDPAGVTARTMALTAAVDASPAAIAAGLTANPGDGAVALSLSQLRTGTLAPLGASAGDFYAGIVSGVGTLVQDAARQSDAAGTLVSNADTRRASVSGVSLDEEMVTLMVQQQAYTAATRLVSTANQMMDDLLRMI